LHLVLAAICTRPLDRGEILRQIRRLTMPWNGPSCEGGMKNQSIALLIVVGLFTAAHVFGQPNSATPSSPAGATRRIPGTPTDNNAPAANPAPATPAPNTTSSGILRQPSVPPPQMPRGLNQNPANRPFPNPIPPTALPNAGISGGSLRPPPVPPPQMPQGLNQSTVNRPLPNTIPPTPVPPHPGTNPKP